MKLAMTVLLIATLAVGCTITVKPIPTKPVAKKRSYHSRHYSSSRTVRPKPKTQTNIKETWWIENYKKLESAHGDYSISEDAQIEPLPDGRFKVPDAVLKHYQDMLLVKPTPKP